MDSFSISQLAQFSGIKSHTIRIWEKRYNALKPERTEGNTRYYSGSQLRRLLNIVSLLGGEHKVSQLCEMSDKELFRLVEKEKDSSQDKLENYFISQLISAAINFEEEAFNSIFSHCLIRYGMKDTYTHVIYPFLVQTGTLWACDTMAPAHEHFILNLIRQKLSTAIDMLPAPGQPEKWLLFLPENEFHETGLLFAHYLIRQSGRKVIYLGVNLPLNSIISAIESTKPDKILSFVVHREQPLIFQKYLDTVTRPFTGKKMYLVAKENLLREIKGNKKIAWLHSVSGLEKVLAPIV